MPEMRGIQLNDAATDDLPAYLAGVREDQVLYVSPTDATPIEEILCLGAGRRIVVLARMKR